MTRTSKLTSKLTAWGLLAALAATTVGPVLADSNGRQQDKNNWRNLGIAGAVIAGYGLLTGNKAATVLGAAGGAYSANRYEQDRHTQSQDNSNEGRRYHRTYGWQPPVVNNNRYNNSYGNSNNRYNNRDNNGYSSNNGYGNNGYGNNGYGSNNDQYNNGQYDNGSGYGNGWAKKQKHHGQGWYKNHSNQDGDRDNGHRG